MQRRANIRPRKYGPAAPEALTRNRELQNEKGETGWAFAHSPERWNAPSCNAAMVHARCLLRTHRFAGSNFPADGGNAPAAHSQPGVLSVDHVTGWSYHSVHHHYESQPNYN